MNRYLGTELDGACSCSRVLVEEDKVLAEGLKLTEVLQLASHRTYPQSVLWEVMARIPEGW